MRKVFIDAGHGGRDTGATGRRSKEKDNCLHIARAIRKHLKRRGYSVKMSRTTDRYLSLTQRTNLANKWGADLFISVHNNAATAKARGFETYIYNGHVSAATHKFQDAVHRVIAKGIDTKNRGKKRANFAVVRQTRMSAILIEYAFITNRQDEKILVDQYDKLGQLTANGVEAYDS